MNPSTSNSQNGSLNSEIVKIDDELASLDQQIGQLRHRQRELREQRRLLLLSESSTDDDDRWEKGPFTWTARVDATLQEIFKLPSFRPLQKSTVNAVLSGRDVLLVMSTGGGKSLCYQLPAVVSGGITLVVSPLISLVEDQLRQLRALNIECASMNASTSKEETRRIDGYMTAKDSPPFLLYVTPEKLAKSKRIMNKLEKCAEIGRLTLIAVDEVHCCAQWGNDFRPDYRFLEVLKRQFPRVPILGLTATATHSVLTQVKEMLKIPCAIVFRAGFNRENLFYEVVQKDTTDCGGQLAGIIKKRFSGESGIVYCFRVQDCETVATELKERGVRAAAYHASLDDERRIWVQTKWTSGDVDVIVATVAFGMGIDKPNVRFVIHHTLPKSVENYYQESGRAGRDGQPAVCLLLFSLSDYYKLSTNICNESVGTANLRKMLEYASQRAKCRRLTLSAHFNEDWKENWCKKTCDVCRDGGELREEDVHVVAASVKATIEEALKKGKVTGSKLVETLAKKSIDRERLEAVIAFLLVSNLLDEDFHFTPYSIISYAKWNGAVPKPLIWTRRVPSSTEPPTKKRNTIVIDLD